MELIDIELEIKELLGQINYYDYYTFTFAVDNLPLFTKDVNIIIKNLTKENQGHLMGWYKRWADTNICTFCTISHSEISVEETE